MTSCLADVVLDGIGRLGGPLSFRFVFQPAMSLGLGIYAGLRDARRGRPPYLWAIARRGADRAALAREGWRDVAKVFVLAVVLDCVYQQVVTGVIHPFAALLVAVTLAVMPYLLVRGPTTRIAARRRSRPG